MKTLRTIAILIGAAAVYAGCTHAPPSGDEEAQGPEVEEFEDFVAGELMATVQVSPDHKLEFFDFGEGETGVRETYQKDSGAEPVLPSVRARMDLADIYRLATAGKADIEMPTAILQADERARAIAAQLPAPGAEEVRLPPPVPEVALDELRVQDELRSVAALNCSPDHLGDLWSGPWFVEQHCNAGQFRGCEHNWGGANTGWQKGSWFHWQQMEGDYNERGHTRGKSGKWTTCPPLVACGVWWDQRIAWDHDVLPGQIVVWGWSGTSSWWHMAEGTSQCGHLHHAFLFNQ